MPGFGFNFSVSKGLLGSNVNQPATIGTPVIDSITDTGFVISCLVTPGTSPVTPQLQWGLTTGYAGTPVNATEGEITEATTCHFTVTGASIYSTYHFKVVADTIESADFTVVTLSKNVKALLTATNYLYIRTPFTAALDLVERHLIDTAQNGVFNFYESRLIAYNAADTEAAYLGGTRVKMSDDDIAPASTGNISYIGANHGYLTIILTVASHDKVSADLGSLWRDNNGAGANRWYLMAIPDSTHLQFIRQSPITGDSWAISNNTPDGSPFVHVSGATNTGNITYSGLTKPQARPINKNKSVQFLADGVALTAGTVTSCNQLVVIDQYDVCDPHTDGDGTENPAKITLGANVWNFGSTWWTNYTKYTFRERGQCEIYARKTLARSMRFVYDGFMQADVLSTSATYTRRYAYFPKTKPIPGGAAINITGASAANPIVITANTHGLVDGDYTTIASITGTIGTVLNGITHAITRVDANSFSVAVDGTGLAYTSGGTSTKTHRYKSIAFIGTGPNAEQQFNVTYVDDVTNPPDRWIEFLTPASLVRTVGFAMGYAVDRMLGSKTNRASNATRWWAFNTAHKSYPYAVHSGSNNYANAIPASTVLECTAYRVMFNPQQLPNTTAFYYVELADCWMVYIDYHSTVANDAVTLPKEMYGKAISVLDSEACTLTEAAVPADGIIHLSTTGGYGFATLKISK